MKSRAYRYGDFDVLLEKEGRKPLYWFTVILKHPDKDRPWQTTAWLDTRHCPRDPYVDFIWNVLEDLERAWRDPDKWKSEEAALDALRTKRGMADRKPYTKAILEGAAYFGELLQGALDQMVREQRHERFLKEIQKHPTPKDWIPQK